MSIRDRLAGVKVAAQLRELQATTEELQPLLESGTNIKTINGSSLLGAGDLAISGATPIYANVQRAAEQAIAGGAWTAVSFDTEVSDSGALFSLGSPTYIEVPSTGIYTISASVPWKTSKTAVANRGVTICKNGAPASNILAGVWHGGSDSTTAQSCSWTGVLTASDKVYLYVLASGNDDIRVGTAYGPCTLGIFGVAI